MNDELLKLKENLPSYFRNLNTEFRAAQFIEKNAPELFVVHYYSTDICEDIYKKAINYLKSEVEYQSKRISAQIDKEISEFVVNKDSTYFTFYFGNYEFKDDLLTGLGVGAGISILLETAFLPLAGIGLGLGFIANQLRLKKKLIESIVNAAKQVNKQAIEYFKNEIDRICNFKIARLNYVTKDVEPKALFDNGLTQKQKEIKHFLEERNIKRLIHFTDKSNVENIIKHGLLSRKRLDSKNIKYSFGDDKRLDNALDYISVSIGNKNTFLFNRYLSDHRIKNPVIIRIDARFLYLTKNNLIFCDRNAASGLCHKGTSIKDLESMYAENIFYEYGSFRNLNRNDLRNDLPTDPQAEILIQGEIPLEYLYFLEKNGYINYKTINNSTIAKANEEIVKEKNPIRKEIEPLSNVLNSVDKKQANKPIAYDTLAKANNVETIKNEQVAANKIPSTLIEEEKKDISVTKPTSNFLRDSKIRILDYNGSFAKDNYIRQDSPHIKTILYMYNCDRKLPTYDDYVELIKAGIDINLD